MAGRRTEIDRVLELDRKSVCSPELTGNFKVSFQYFDASQKYGSSFRDWQRCGLLSRMLEVLSGFCHRKLTEQVDGGKFTIYGSFPPDDSTLFSYPSGVPEDANWARIHVNGRSVVIGHVVNDTFYVVFLDKTHKFWISKKK